VRGSSRSKGKVMKWQAWRGFAVGVFASLGLIGGAGAGLANAAVEPEPSFELPTEAGEAVATVAPGPEPSFELPAETGEAFATVGPGPEPSFELPTEAREAHATVAPQSETYFGLRSVQLPEKHFGGIQLLSRPSPNSGEADRNILVRSPRRFPGDPALVDHLLVHLCEHPANGHCRLDMLGEEVEVGLDGDRRTVGGIEMRRHPGLHDEEWVKPDEHVRTARFDQARRLPIQRAEIAEVLVDERRSNQFIAT